MNLATAGWMVVGVIFSSNFRYANFRAFFPSTHYHGSLSLFLSLFASFPSFILGILNSAKQVQVCIMAKNPWKNGFFCCKLHFSASLQVCAFSGWIMQTCKLGANFSARSLHPYAFRSSLDFEQVDGCCFGFVQRFLGCLNPEFVAVFLDERFEFLRCGVV